MIVITLLVVTYEAEQDATSTEVSGAELPYFML